MLENRPRAFSRAVAGPWILAICLAWRGPAWSEDPTKEKPLPPPAARKVEFTADIRPILESKCFSCHGAAKQRAGFRLDTRAGLLAGGNTGPAVAPGDSTRSLLVRYVAGVDPDVIMPPEGDPLTPEQVGLLRAWIDQGVEWPDDGGAPAKSALTSKTDHWSFHPPVRPDLPSVRNSAWPRSPIDYFVLARLEQEGLSPSPEADRHTLARRLSLDLIGLPPTPEEADAFALDSSAGAYERYVERLLASPHYGERWARHWLDLARYADTNGFEKDRVRSIWPYRDWVIRAFNEDMPFDRFTIEQIAGDMLPNAGLSQKVATGFHRNTMINEEGGIDVEEFRYEAVVDRVKTTGAVWLGLTLNCAQCHDHKFDPITQREYWEVFAFLNNADEPDLDVPGGEDLRRRDTIQAGIEAIEARLEEEFPPFEERRTWEVLDPSQYAAFGGSVLAKLEDHSLLAVGENPAAATYEMEVALGPGELDSFRLEALVEKRLDAKGPGRAGNGNFVLSEFAVILSATEGAEAAALSFSSAIADVSQTGFPASAAIDGNPRTGWAVDNGSGDLRRDLTATFQLQHPILLGSGATARVVLKQAWGNQHTLGKFRLLAGKVTREHLHPELPLAEQRALHLREKLAEWEAKVAPEARRWTLLDPESFTSELGATLTELEDRSILASGDRPNRDRYRVEFPSPLETITAIKLETLPHESLPDNGPGRGDVMGKGDFMISDLRLYANGALGAVTLELVNASEAPFDPDHGVEKAIDGVADTGWKIMKGGGIPHTAVFGIKEPRPLEAGSKLSLVITQWFLHQSTLGRFRVWVTADPAPVKAIDLRPEVEAALVVAPAERTPEQLAAIKMHFLSISPDLSEQHSRIAALRAQIPVFPTTLVMQERATLRKTHVHVRGEFLRKGIEVEPGVPAVLHPLPKEKARNRLTFAEWLVDEDNPLVGRVVMNRLWQAYFGRGFVYTAEDFGIQGEPPSHPELLDWLATEFAMRKWSLKEMHRLVVTSATYRQSSRATPELLARDPANILLARGPRFRVESEMVRDIALTSSGLLNPKIGGPSVFPPQPEGVMEVAYGGAKWPASAGGDRYRRALYTHLKRTALYPGLTVFDMPPPDTVCTRRSRANTPLQSLTILNDEVYVEAARALARRVLAEGPEETEGRIRFAFRAILTREPLPREVDRLKSFQEARVAEFTANPEAALQLAALTADANRPDAEACALAAWTATCRVILNLDEAITKE
ncbi:MAG: hypothetical protein GHCLOJNM_00724 [bacterium]|nr:hypothetical protein [bacterium]